jgi:broad specificity phosphatase PhoE
VIIHLLRHGETAHNRSAVGLGREDVPLTEFGEAQARALGLRFAGQPLDAIFASPLRRASDVAAYVAGEREIRPQLRAELTELDVGETEGMEFPKMRELYPEFMRRWATADTSVRMPGGESIDDVALRLQPFLQDLGSLEADHVAVVSHNFVTKILICELLRLPLSSFRALSADLASVTTIATTGTGRATLHVMNDTCHLHSLERTVGEA